MEIGMRVEPDVLVGCLGCGWVFIGEDTQLIGSSHACTISIGMASQTVGRLTMASRKRSFLSCVEIGRVRRISASCLTSIQGYMCV